MNPASQPIACPIKVPSVTPTTVDTAMPPMTMEMARPWRSGGTRPSGYRERYANEESVYRTGHDLRDYEHAEGDRDYREHVSTDVDGQRHPQLETTAETYGQGGEDGSTDGNPQRISDDKLTGGADRHPHVLGDEIQDADDNEFGRAHNKRAQPQRSKRQIASGLAPPRLHDRSHTSPTPVRIANALASFISMSSLSATDRSDRGSAGYCCRRVLSTRGKAIPQWDAEL